jgi:predicted nucleotidyltransferase
MNSWDNDKELLDEIVRRLVEAVDPDRIILFGSRARGDARPDSDVDLLIIKDSDQPIYRRAIPAYRALSGLGVPKDIKVIAKLDLAEFGDGKAVPVDYKHGRPMATEDGHQPWPSERVQLAVQAIVSQTV